jgi:hypothetical protein
LSVGGSTNNIEDVTPKNDPEKLPVLIWAELDTVPVGSPDGRTNDAVVATEAVPCNEPVTLPDNEPVIGVYTESECNLCVIIVS